MEEFKDFDDMIEKTAENIMRSSTVSRLKTGNKNHPGTVFGAGVNLCIR